MADTRITLAVTLWVELGWVGLGWVEMDDGRPKGEIEVRRAIWTSFALTMLGVNLLMKGTL